MHWHCINNKYWELGFLGGNNKKKILFEMQLIVIAASEDFSFYDTV